MQQDRRDIFKKIGTLGASALALAGVSNPAKADEAAASNPLVGLWDMTIPLPGTGVNLYYKYAISEGAYVCTGDDDLNPAIDGFIYGPTMGTYARTGHNSYRLRERVWSMNPDGTSSGSAEFTGTARVAEDEKSFAGSGTYTQYNLNGGVLFTLQLTYTAVKFPA